MIRVRIQRDSKQRPVAVVIKGHALFAEYGQDIVCAAISMLVQTVVFALHDLLHVKPFLRMQEGYLVLIRPKKLGQDRDKEAQCFLLLETLILGLREAAGAYAAHISYKEKIVGRLVRAKNRNKRR